MRIERSGIISINGWSKNFNLKQDMILRIDGKKIELNEFNRYYREDLAEFIKDKNSFLGFSFVYLIKKSLKNSLIKITMNGKLICDKPVTFEILTPHYQSLLNESGVMHREFIYGYGPPNEVLSDEIIRLIKSFMMEEAKILDFGCGRGNIVNFLKNEGINAYGIEIDRPEIREVILF